MVGSVLVSLAGSWGSAGLGRPALPARAVSAALARGSLFNLISAPRTATRCLSSAVLATCRPACACRLHVMRRAGSTRQLTPRRSHRIFAAVARRTETLALRQRPSVAASTAAVPHADRDGHGIAGRFLNVQVSSARVEAVRPSRGMMSWEADPREAGRHSTPSRTIRTARHVPSTLPADVGDDDAEPAIPAFARRARRTSVIIATGQRGPVAFARPNPRTTGSAGAGKARALRSAYAPR